MNAVDRPNRDALNSALDIYRDALRSFIVRCLKKVQGTQVEDVIRDALNDRQAAQFSQNLRQNDNIEAVWEPLEVNEAFEVVRRRLFGNVINESERNRTCETFSRMYNPRDYPQGTNEQRYLERMKACYPIHPEIFDRLYEDWSAIPRETDGDVLGRAEATESTSIQSRRELP